MNYEQIILKRLEEGTLIRRAWTREKEGKELACLLAAIVPRCGELKSAIHCPAGVMPQWLAYLTPWIDDAGTEEKWESVVRRFAATSSRWESLTQRHEYAIRALIVREVDIYILDPEVTTACNRVIELCDGVAAGGGVDEEAFFSARAAAKVAATSTLSTPAVCRAVATAAWAADTAEVISVESAARTAAAAPENADRIIDGILCVLAGA